MEVIQASHVLIAGTLPYDGGFVFIDNGNLGRGLKAKRIEQRGWITGEVFVPCQNIGIRFRIVVSNLEM
jgi:hypothetical protein